jgi:hypothetical protein
MQENQAQQSFGILDVATAAQRPALAGASLPVGGQQSFHNIPVRRNKLIAHKRNHNIC